MYVITLLGKLWWRQHHHDNHATHCVTNHSPNDESAGACFGNSINNLFKIQTLGQKVISRFTDSSVIAISQVIVGYLLFRAMAWRCWLRSCGKCRRRTISSICRALRRVWMWRTSWWSSCWVWRTWSFSASTHKTGATWFCYKTGEALAALISSDHDSVWPSVHLQRACYYHVVHCVTYVSFVFSVFLKTMRHFSSTIKGKFLEPFNSQASLPLRITYMYFFSTPTEKYERASNTGMCMMYQMYIWRNISAVGDLLSMCNNVHRSETVGAA